MAESAYDVVVIGSGPGGYVAAIRASRGGVILRMDGHAEPDPGYVSACIEVLETSGAWNVGGRIRKVGIGGLEAGH